VNTSCIFDYDFNIFNTQNSQNPRNFSLKFQKKYNQVWVNKVYIPHCDFNFFMCKIAKNNIILAQNLGENNAIFE
jgi:hypothetical protein